MKYKEYNDADTSQRPVFMCQTGKGKDSVQPYPQQLQERLRAALEKVQNGEGAQEEEDEMADEWVSKLRLFTEEEYNEHWKDSLSKHVRDGNGKVVGAQWNSNFDGKPPTSWDDNATYRPIYLGDALLDDVVLASSNGALQSGAAGSTSP